MFFLMFFLITCLHGNVAVGLHVAFVTVVGRLGMLGIGMPSERDGEREILLQFLHDTLHNVRPEEQKIFFCYLNGVHNLPVDSGRLPPAVLLLVLDQDLGEAPADEPNAPL
jgi:hypothetical protein